MSKFQNEKSNGEIQIAIKTIEIAKFKDIIIRTIQTVVQWIKNSDVTKESKGKI